MVNEKCARTKAELAMIGLVVQCDNENECVYMTDYILKTLGKETLGRDILTDYINRHGNFNVKYLVVNHQEDMNMITYLLDSEKESVPEDITTNDGVFCYVYNISIPYYSELGYSFFERTKSGFYRRIS